MAINQAHLFLIFTLNGFLIGLIFDFFRILRKSFKTCNLATYFEDIIFWILSALSIIYSMVRFSNGSLRFFMVIGLLIGFLIYILTISKYIMKFSVSLIIFIKKIVYSICNVLKYPLRLIRKIIIFPLKSIQKIIYILKNNFFDNKYKNINQIIIRKQKNAKKRRIFLKNVEK